MRRIQVILLASAVALAPTLVAAEMPVAASEAAAADAVVEDPQSPQDAPVVSADAPADELAWGEFDDPEFDPAADTQPGVPATPTAEPTVGLEQAGNEAGVATADAADDGIQLIGSQEIEVSQGVRLGPVGIDDLGRRGRLHTVAPGDTLWDLSAAYLGTPWVWPSVWIENEDIKNPDLIMPGDKIWITANEMRIVTDAQAESFVESFVEETPAAADESMAFEDDGEMEPSADAPVAALEADDPSTFDAFPVAVPGEKPEEEAPGLQVTVSRRDAMGFVSVDDLAGASSIVDSPVERTYLASGDRVVIGMGEGDLEVGDQFTIFRVVESVRDVESNRILGHHIDILGWAVVRELTGDTAVAEIRTSYSEIRRGARVMPREKLSRHVTARPAPDAIEGKIVFLPGERTVMADGGYVYLNRGEFHGIEVGSELEVFEAGGILNDKTRRVGVRTPDETIARLVVVSVKAETSVAFVLTSSRELEVGDDVRPRLERLAHR